MKIINLLNAKQPLERLLGCKFTSFKVVRELANLKKSIDGEIEFYISEEKKLVYEYASKDEKGNPIVLEGGRIQFDTIESKEEFEKEITSLRDVDIDGVKAITLNESDFKSLDDLPTPNDFIALEGIIDLR